MNIGLAMSASSSFSICRTTNPRFSRVKVQLPAAQARSQSFRDEGNYSHTVDANMSVLRCRMEQVRMKERLDTCHNYHGWNYRSPYDVVQEKNNIIVMSSIIQLACVVATTVGLVFLCGSVCIFLVALIFHP